MNLFCASGCVVRGRHGPDCSGKDGAGQECEGCEPRAVERGMLCRWCWNRLNGMLTDIPGLVEHLTDVASVVISSPMGKSSDGGRPQAGSRMLYPASLEAADELVAMVGTWVDLIVADHPAQLREPSTIGWRYSTNVLRWSEFAEAWVVESPRRLGATQAAVDEMVKWLRPHLPWIAEQEWVPAMLDDLGPLMARIKARWPMSERAHPVPMPCPSCEQWSLVYDPPGDVGAQVVVTCSNIECSKQWRGQDWHRLLKGVVGSEAKKVAG